MRGSRRDVYKRQDWEGRGDFFEERFPRPSQTLSLIHISPTGRPAPAKPKRKAAIIQFRPHRSPEKDASEEPGGKG